nr:vWA domain-containing protein [Ketobacter sp.]
MKHIAHRMAAAILNPARLTPLILAPVVLGASLFSAHHAHGATPLKVENKTSIYQRVLTVPGCELAEQMSSRSGKPQPAFTRFYVYQRQEFNGAKWLQVGPDSYGNTSGWMKADCTVPWNMQMTLAFTNPADRHPLLFFKDRAPLDDLFAEEEPEAPFQAILQAVDTKGRHPQVVSREPEYQVSLEENFYLLPVMEAEETFTEQGYRARILKVASVSKQNGAGAKSATNGNAKPKASNENAKNLFKGFSASIVFVIDSTISMGPYIERTKEAINNIYQVIEKKELLDKVKFGLVAYRSSVAAAPGLEYVSKMYVDPVTVKDGKDFLEKVKTLKPASVSSKAFNEDAYAGVMQALDDVKWNEFGARYLILVTDAGALDGDDALSGTGLSASQVKLEADYRGVAIYALHLKTPSGKNNHAEAEQQYSELTHNAVLNKPLYFPVEAGDVDRFGRKVDALAEAIAAQVKLAYSGEQAAGSALNANPEYGRSKKPAPPVSADNTEDEQLLQDTLLLGHAMQLAYLGEVTGAKAPNVFEGWISDRDIVEQTKPTVDVRVLLTKSQLSDLSDIVKQIADAANQGLISPTDMFKKLQSLSATMGKDANQVKQAESTALSEMGLMGEYIEGLPYLSEVLMLDEETWKSWSGLQQEKFIRRLNTKLKYYRKYNDDVDRWVSLAEGSDPREHVYPVPLEMLP